MSKRNVATVLWFAMGWTVGSMLAVVVGLPPVFGVAMGIPFAWVIRMGPAKRVWTTETYGSKQSPASIPGAPLATE